MRVFYIDIPPAMVLTTVADRLDALASNPHNHGPADVIRRILSTNPAFIRSEFGKTKDKNKKTKDKNKGKQDKDKEKLETLIAVNNSSNTITTNTLTKDIVDELVLDGVIFTDEHI
jgi:hypothetical protein